MSFQPTTSRDIIKPLQFVEEGTTAATYGVTPTSPTFTAAGINVEISLDPKIESEIIRALGSEDLADSILVSDSYAFTLRSHMLNTTLAKYGIQAANSGGTIGASLTFQYSKRVDGVERFTKITGCRAISTRLSVNRGLWLLEQTWHAKNIEFDTIAGDAGATYITSIPSGAPFKHQDQSNPFTWNGTVFPEKSFELTVTRELGVLEINGQTQVQNSRAAVRRIEWSAETAKNSSTLIADFKAAAKRTLSYKIGPTESINFTNAVIKNYIESHTGGSDTIQYDRISGDAATVSIV